MACGRLEPNGTYLACSTGLTSDVVTQTFLNERDYCVLVQLLPKLTVHHAEDLLTNFNFIYGILN